MHKMNTSKYRIYALNSIKNQLKIQKVYGLTTKKENKKKKSAIKRTKKEIKEKKEWENTFFNDGRKWRH